MFHEYKKHGKVTTVQIVNEGDNRHAVVSFRKYATYAFLLFVIEYWKSRI